MKLCGKWSKTVKNDVEVPYGIHAGRSGRYTAGALVLQAAVTVAIATPDGAIGCRGCRGGRRGVSWRVIEPVERAGMSQVYCVSKRRKGWLHSVSNLVALDEVAAAEELKVAALRSLHRVRVPVQLEPGAFTPA